MAISRSLAGAALTIGTLAIPFLCGGAASAQTAPPCETSGIAGTGAFFPSNLIGLGSTGCVIGDKTYSDFTFSSNFTPTAVFGFTNTPSDQHTFSGAALNLTASNDPYLYGYTVKVTGSGETILSYKTGITTSDLTNIDATNSLDNDYNAGDSIASLPGAGAGTGGVGNLVDLTTPPPGAGSSVKFDGTIIVNKGRVDTLTDSLNQTPGPLPILGAGTAFGFSRKLRKRIKASC